MSSDSSSSDIRFRRWTRKILIVAALLRLSYLLWGEVLPVMWDARTYASAALGLISYIDPPQEHNDLSAKAYDELSQKYIQGEQVDWLYYNQYTLGEARDAIFFGGPLYPACLAAIFVISPVADFTVARVFNLLLDLLCCWLLMKITWRLAGETAAYIAGALYAIYFPFILCSSMLLLETPTTCLILATIWLAVSAHGRAEASRRYIGAGVCLGLLILVKPSAMLIFAPLAIAGVVWLRYHGGVTLRIVRQVATPLLVTLTCWTVVASIHYGALTLRDPEYADANLRQSSSLRNDAYDLDEVEPNFWQKPIFGEASDDPLGYLGLLSRKIYRMWSRPYNDFDRAWVVPYRISEWLHLFFVIGGAIGLAILARRSVAHAAIPLAIVFYYTILHAVFHSIPRYNVNAMPMVLLGAGFAGQLVWEGFQAGRIVPRLSLGLLAAAAAMILPGVISPTMGSVQWIVAGMLALQISFVCLAVWLLLPATRAAREERWIAIGLVAMIGLLCYVPFKLHSPALAEFRTRINNSSAICGTKIFARGIQPVDNEEVLAIIIDMTSGPADDAMFRVSIAGHPMEVAQDKPPLSDLFYKKLTYTNYARFEGIRNKEIRQWAIIPVNPSLVAEELERRGFLSVEVTAASTVPIVGGQFVVYGRTDIRNDGGSLPAVRHTSIERWVCEDDPRIPLERRFLSDSAVSYYIRRDNVAANAVGAPETSTVVQGRHSIYLMHFKADGLQNIY